MKTKKIALILLILSLLSLAAHLCLLPRMPDVVPTHWGFDGTVDGYSGKYTTIFLAALPLLMLGLFLVLPKLDPKGDSYRKHQKAYNGFMILITLFCIAILWASNAVIFGYPVNIGQVVPVGMGILFLVIGNYMPQIRQNYTLGIKTPWTLDNEWVWKKTHAMGGVIFCVSGLLMIVSGFLPFRWLSTASIVILLAGCLWLYVYSWMLYKKQKK